MKKAGKYLIAAALAALVTAMPLTSYGFGWSAKTETKAEEEKTYQYKSGETVIAMNAEAAPVVKALGTPKSTFEQDSCAYQGKAKTYSYDGLELSTSVVGGKELIESLYITGKDDKLATPEGIKIGSKKQDVINAYGKNYKEEFGTLRYTLGNTQVSFYLTNGAVDAIEYMVVATK